MSYAVLGHMSSREAHIIQAMLRKVKAQLTRANTESHYVVGIILWALYPIPNGQKATRRFTLGQAHRGACQIDTANVQCKFGISKQIRHFFAKLLQCKYMDYFSYHQTMLQLFLIFNIWTIV